MAFFLFFNTEASNLHVLYLDHSSGRLRLVHFESPKNSIITTIITPRGRNGANSMFAQWTISELLNNDVA